jgi:hypothetical protein
MACIKPSPSSGSQWLPLTKENLQDHEKTAWRKQASAQKKRERAMIAKDRAKVIQDKFKDSVINLRKKQTSEIIKLLPDDLPISYLIDLIPMYLQRRAAQEHWDAVKERSARASDPPELN